MDVSSAPAAAMQFSLQPQDAKKFDFETCYSSGESSILMSHAPSQASAVTSGCGQLPISGVCETNGVLRVNAPTAFAPLDDGTGPSAPEHLNKVPFCCPVVSLYAWGTRTVLLQGGLLLSRGVPLLEVLMAPAGACVER